MSDGTVVGQLKGPRDPFNIEWEVDFLSLSAEVDKHYRSPMFFFCNSSWCLKLYPIGQKSHSSEGYVGVYAMKGDSGPPATVTYSLFLKKMDGRKVISEKAEYTFEKKDVGRGKSKAIGRSELIDQKSVYFPTGVLTLICCLKCDEARVDKDTGREVSLQTTTCAEISAAMPDTKFRSDFEKILLSKEDCDVTLQVQDQKFEAHRIILKARSSVFASMLMHDMIEKNTGVIDIKDCEPEYFLDFLKFLYCGSTDSISSQNACSLYRAGDKYDIQDLKSGCLTFIKSHLDVDNFCDVITLALQYGETDLIKQSTDFFTKNMLSIVLTVKWQAFHKEKPDESNELIIKGLSAQKSSDN